MKAIKLLALLLVLGLMACGGGDDESGSSEPTVRELTIDETAIEYISSEGEVDNYHFRAAETNRFLRITCKENSQNSGVEVMVTVSEETANGERVRLFGQHKRQNATTAADIDFLIYIDSPKNLYINVRDLMDDDANTKISYHLRLQYLNSADGNHDFATAQELSLDEAVSGSGEISEVGEVDCFTFTPSIDSVQAIHINQHVPQDGTQVHLAASLYDNAGSRIQRVVAPGQTILSYLTADHAPYFLTVEDSDSMHADESAGYEIVIEAVTAAEMKQNDVSDNAGAMNEINGGFIATGAIDYASSSDPPENAGDKDWYHFEVTGGGGDFSQVELTIDNGGVFDPGAMLRVIVFNDAMQKQSSHEFRCGSSPYLNQFKATNGTYYLMVESVPTVLLTRSTAYEVGVRETDFEDTAEQDDDNTESSAIVLTAGVAHTDGMVSYNSDVDWYSLAVTSGLPRIMSVELTSDQSVVDYQLVVAPGAGADAIKKRTDFNGSDAPTRLKTSVYVAEPTTFYFRVGDAQNDEGSSIPYTIVANLDDIPVSVTPMSTGTTRYYSEAEEQAGVVGSGYGEVEIEVLANIQPKFKVNLDWMDFHADTLPTGVTIDTDAGTGDSTITFPWIAGYIDYQGDYDVFQIDFNKLDPAGAETQWYYEVEVHLVVPTPGSHVEYVWKLYRDQNRNGIVMDNPTADDGYKACAGDTTPSDGPDNGTPEPVDLITPSGSETFWIGDEWGADSIFYLGISDFYYQRYPGEGARNTLPVIPWPDEDWGYDTPYYIQMTLTYHPGASQP